MVRRPRARRYARRMRSGGLIAACCALLVAIAGPAHAAQKHDWVRFGFDAKRSNWSKAVAGLSAGDLPHLRRTDIALPGTVDSSPAYLHAITVKGAKRDVFFVTTTYGRTIALDARSDSILWTYTPPSYPSLAGGLAFEASSPVVDRKAGFVYGPAPDGLIHKLSIATGTEVTSGSWPARVTLDPKHEKLSSALNLNGRWVYVAIAGHEGDKKPYVGHVALVNRQTGAVEHIFNAICSNRHELIDPATCNPPSGAGIWGRAAPVVVPGSHNILATTGNSKFDGKRYWGDTVLELSPDASKLLHNYTPTNQTAMEAYDVDLGATSPALMRSGRRWLALQSGKDGEIRLLDVATLNGRKHASSFEGGELQFIHTPGDNPVVSAPAVWRHDKHSWAYVATYTNVTAYKLSNGKHPKLHKEWAHSRGGSSPVIAGGLVYVFNPTEGGINVYRPASGKRVATIPTPGKGHWNSPVVVDGRIALGVGMGNNFPTTGTFSIYHKP